MLPRKLSHFAFRSGNSSYMRTTLGVTFRCRCRANRPRQAQFVYLPRSCRKRAVNTLSIKSVSFCTGVFRPVLVSGVRFSNLSYCHYPCKGAQGRYNIRYIRDTRGTFGRCKGRATTIVIRPVLRKTTNVHVCPTRCLEGLHGLYSTCNILVVSSRVTTNFNEAKGLFTVRRTNVSPSVLYASGKLATKCVPVSLAVAASGMCSTFCSSCKARGTFIRDRACTNGPVNYTVTLAMLGVVGQSRVLRGIGRGKVCLRSGLVGTLKGRERIKRVHRVKLVGTVRLIRGGRAGGTFSPGGHVN